MKKAILFIILLGYQTSFAQNGDYAKNEIKYNILNTMIIASVEVGYERFVDQNQSVETEILINDRVNYHSEKGSRNFETNSIKIGYNYYFGKNDAGSGIYVNPFFKYRFGEFSEDITINEVSAKATYDLDALIIGIGGGYKWNSNNKFVFGPYANIGRNFSKVSSDRFTAIEFNAGILIGYRF